jgi:hypothetical protein
MDIVFVDEYQVVLETIERGLWVASSGIGEGSIFSGECIYMYFFGYLRAFNVICEVGVG